MRDIGASKRTGTLVKFKPDPEIFHEVTFDYDTLEDRLRELAFLNKGLTLSLHDERTGKEEVFKSDGGLAEFVKYINRTEEPLHPPIYIEKTVDQVAVEVVHAVHARRGGAQPLLHQQRLQLDRRHAPERLPHGPDADAQRLRRQGGTVQERHRRSARTSARG